MIDLVLCSRSFPSLTRVSDEEGQPELNRTAKVLSDNRIYRTHQTERAAGLNT
jgi:hypothetical protein